MVDNNRVHVDAQVALNAATGVTNGTQRSVSYD